MAALFNTFSKTTASGAATPAIAPVHVRDRIAFSCTTGGTAAQMYGRNAGEDKALVARYLR